VSACVFVVAATEGWKPQSEEHLRILELLGFERGFVVLTKTDLVEDEWLELARLEVEEHLAGTFLEGAPLLGVSSTTGAGLDDVRTALDEFVGDLEAAGRGRPRMWLDRVFAAKGSGTVTTGTLAGGALSVDQHVAVEPGGHVARIRGIQVAGRTVESVGPGNRVALNLAGVDHHELQRGDAVVETDRWRLTDRFDAALDVLTSLDHEVSRRGAYVAYIGAGEYPAKLRVLGSQALAPGVGGAVRIFLPVGLPLLPGDRFILRESGRDETVGGGEILDIAPVLRASRALPDRSIDRVVRERGWVAVDELELLTGEVVEPTIGRWVTTPEAVVELAEGVRRRVDAAGGGGIDVASLDERERAVLEDVEDLVVDSGRVRPADAIDPFEDHPFLAELRAGGFTPPSPDGVDRGDVRELVRRSHAVQRDGIVFHAAAIDDAATIAARLLVEHPDGFTVAQFRDATGTSRKYVLPLVAELDARGVTRRRDDLRIAGPRLPEL
ncbi:MAG: SelB C-terminal domain-containing protein, partial [Ilumatobacteraceae bacterium]